MHGGALLLLLEHGGARALRLGDKIGSLEAGKDADVQAVSFDDLESMPVYNVRYYRR